MTIFLLSPARCGGERARQLAASSTSEVGRRLHLGDAEIGEVFSWLSALYFRGKLAYARRFAADAAGVLVMAPGAGLVSPDGLISAKALEAMGKIEIESAKFTKPLTRDALALAARHRGNVVLLGSIATGKYVDAISAAFGARLHYPSSFVGRGDMSRGGLLLRSVTANEELEYAPLVADAPRHGSRPPKLVPLAKAPSVSRQT